MQNYLLKKSLLLVMVYFLCVATEANHGVIVSKKIHKRSVVVYVERRDNTATKKFVNKLLKKGFGDTVPDNEATYRLQSAHYSGLRYRLLKTRVKLKDFFSKDIKITKMHRPHINNKKKIRDQWNQKYGPQ